MKSRERKSATDVDRQTVVVGDRVRLTGTHDLRWDQLPVVTVTRIHAQGADGTILTTDPAPDPSFPHHFSGRATYFRKEPDMSKKEPVVSRTAPVAKMLNSGKARKNAAKRAKKVVDTPATADVSSAASMETSVTQDISSSVETSTQTAKDTTTMVISLTRDNKARKSNAVTYTAAGYNGSVRFSKSFFADKTGPESLTLDSEAFAAARQPRAKMTPEERKAARAAAPKLTPAEKLAKIEERAAKLRAKIAASAPAS